MITALLLVLAQTVAATPAPTPPPAPKLGGGFSQKVVNPKKASVVITDDTLAPTGRGGTMSVSGTRTAAPSGTPVPGAAVAVVPDDEATWRGRAASLRASLSTAETDLARAEAMNPVILGGRPGHMVEIGASARNAALSPYRVRLMQIRGELAGLPEECRKTSGCQPGWIR